MNLPTHTIQRTVAALSAVVALRMLGLFLLLPVLAVYADALPAATPLSIGFALGVYGLTQSLFQIPFGIASDKFGRKRIITIGLLIFAAGGIVAALADSIDGVIIGRAIQGAGAISAAVLALTADLTSESQRTKAMAFIGVTIGATFLLSLIIAPLLQNVIGVRGIFWLTAGLAGMAIVLLWKLVPDPPPTDNIANARFRNIITDSRLLRLNFGVFILHLILTALFVTLPALLIAKSDLALAAHWKLYAPVLLLSVIGMVPLILLNSRNKTAQAAFTSAVALLLASTLLMTWASTRDLAAILFSLWLFFVAFNALEAMLPSLVSRIAPSADKGAAIGVFNTCQFLGMFIGGVAAGGLVGAVGAAGGFWLCAAAAGAWLVVAVSSPKFPRMDAP